jgi:hypothetical protein
MNNEIELLKKAAAPFIKLAEEYKAERNDITRYPIWFIAKPIRGGGVKYIRGIFFSKSDAKKHLEARRHEYGKSAIVWCDACGGSFDFTEAFDAALKIIGIDEYRNPLPGKERKLKKVEG